MDEKGGNKRKNVPTIDIASFSDSSGETVVASSVKMQKDRKNTIRLVDEVKDHIQSLDGKKRVKVSKKKNVAVKKKIVVGKKKIANKPEPTSRLLIQVCAHHHMPTSNLCCHYDKNNGKCLMPICSFCVDGHKRGCRAVGNPKLLCRLTTYLCQNHFDVESTNIHHNKEMSMLEYDKEVPLYNELEKLTATTNTSAKEQMITVAEDNINYAESDD